MGGHWNLTKGSKERFIKEERDFHMSRISTRLNTIILTALFWVLIRVVSTVILTITLPAKRLAKSVVALELIQGAMSTH